MKKTKCLSNYKSTEVRCFICFDYVILYCC